MEELLEKARKVSRSAEVFWATAEETEVQFEANRLKHVRSRQSDLVGLRIIRNGRIGYGVTTDKDDFRGLLDAAIETAEFGTEAIFDFPGQAERGTLEVFDAGVGEVPVEKMIQLGQGIIDAVKEHTPEILCEGGVGRDTITTGIRNSSGLDASFRKSILSLGVEGTLIRGTDMLFVAEGDASCRPIAETDHIIATVIRQLDWAKETAPVPTKTLPVIFTPNGVASALVGPLMSALNGRMVLEGASPLGDKLGVRVFDRKFNLYDDALREYRPGSRPFDDEGVPCGNNQLVADGVPQAFFYDLQTAALAKKKSTGNGRRGGGSLPSPSPNAFIFQPGATPFDDMLADIKEGILIEHLMGAGQGNILGGDFSGNVLLGYRIENGKIIGRVKNAIVHGNVYKLLKDIAAVGSDGKWLGGSLFTPSLYLPGISVAAKG